MEIAVLIASLLLKYGPDVANEIAVLIHSNTPPTLEQWQELFKKVRSLDDYVAEAKAEIPAK